MSHHHAPSQETPAVVVRGELNGLGVVRSLARSRIPTYVVDISRARPAMWSRGVRRVLTPSLYGRPLVDTLLAVSRRLGARPVLILTDEAAVVTVAQHREELAAYYRFAGNSPQAVQQLENKARFHEFALASGLPVPAGLVLGRDSNIAELQALTPPFIIKPADKMQVYLGRSERLYRASTLPEAMALSARLVRDVGEIVVQEWVPGPDANIVFCLFYRGTEESQFLSFTGRKLLAHPPQVGSTAVCVAAPELADLLTPVTRDFIAETGYRGFGSLEFKIDQGRGDMRIIEPTVGRTDWQEEIATLSGTNLPLFAYEVETGRQQTAMHTPEASQPVAWRASLQLPLRQAARPDVTHIYDGYWRADDMLPAIVHYSSSIFRRSGKRLAKAVTGAFQNIILAIHPHEKVKDATD